ncbi:MAG: hypothetical protein WBD40_12710 [Tepidisphaeraceae bacterium]
MSTRTASAAPRAAAVPMPPPIDYDGLLAKLGPKDRTNIERHILAAETERDVDHARMWKRLATHLMTLAGHAAKTTGQQSIQFFIADGKYRMQVFALEDLRDGKITIYAGNALEDAIKEGVVTPPPKNEREETHAFAIHHGKDKLILEELDGKTLNPAPFYKDMLGWNRKAIRISLLTTSTPAQLDAAEQLCTISARKWLAKAAKAE